MTMTKLTQLDGKTITLEDCTIEGFRGDCLTQGSDQYEQARHIWNGMINRKPGLIAQCTGTADVAAAVAFANHHNLLVSVKSGGHNIAGSALCDGGLTIDLSGMRGVTVNPNTKHVYVQAGALLGDVDHETQQFGLAVPTGINSTTGIAGLALGGGYGWLSRAYGHTVDNMVSAQIVTADGQVRTASKTENSDLFWAIRGGSGNFGIVTSFEFQCHDVGPTIISGPVIHPAKNASAVLSEYAKLAAKLPDKATCWVVLRKAPPFPFLDEKHHGQPVLILVMAYAGDMDEGAKILKSLRGIGAPLADAVGPHPYAGWQAAFDPLLAAGARNYWKSHDFADLTGPVIDIMSNAVNTLPSDECEIFIAQMGGASSRIPADAMAFPHRSHKYTLNIHGRWQDKNADKTCRDWVRSLFDQSTPHATGSVYVNFMPEEETDRSVGPYGSNQSKLETIKAKYDPKNRLRANINIAPKK